MTDTENQSSHTMPSGSDALFGRWHCEEIIFRFDLTNDKFDYDAFTRKIGKSPEPFEWGDVVCSSRSDYHVHIAWMQLKRGLRLQVGHYSSEGEPSLMRTPPIPAEDAMRFIGDFFKNGSAHAHVHSDFEFPSLQRSSRFPLPLRTTIGSCKSEVDGIALRLIESPCGVTKVWLMQRKDKLSVRTTAERRIVFSDFALENEIRDLRSVIDQVTEMNP